MGNVLLSLTGFESAVLATGDIVNVKILADLGGGGGGGLVGFVSSLNTDPPNDVVPVAVLMADDAISETDQCDVAIVPSGVLSGSTTIGAFSLQVPDDTNAGGSKRGKSAVDLQLWRSSPDQVASGVSSFAAGSANTVSGFVSAAIGDANTVTSVFGSALGHNNTVDGIAASARGINNQASGRAAIAEGSNTVATGDESHAEGSHTTSSASNSHAEGTQTLSDGDSSHAEGLASAARAIERAFVSGVDFLNGQIGSLQRGHYGLAGLTLDDTPLVLLTTVGGSATFNTQVTLPAIWAANNSIPYNGAAYVFHGQLIALNNASGDASAWDFKGVIKQGATAGTTALVAPVTANLIAQDAGMAATVVAIGVDTVNGALQITVTGLAATTINWMCDIQTSETTY